jgi:hypothetical protein
MELFVNELSLHGQFNPVSDFTKALKSLMGCKKVAERYRYPFYCNRSITEYSVGPDISFRQAVINVGNKDLTRLVMRWVDKHGPFLPDEQQHNPSEYFEWNKELVTDRSLGEAAFRTIDGSLAAVISFTPSNFLEHPLNVIWRQSETEGTPCEVPNFWDVAELETHIAQFQPPPASWTEMLEQAQARFVHLAFLDNLHNGLAGEPFNYTVANSIMERLRVLNRIKDSFDDEGTLTAEGNQLKHDFFQGQRAWFSDESDTNKQHFKNEMTFTKPDGQPIFCPYHGKISYRYFRIHHSWPIRHDEPLYIAYIGPKITKS